MIHRKMTLALAACALTACGHVPERVSVSESRTASVAPNPAIPGASSAQRFGASRMGGGAGAGGGGTTADYPLAWDDPAGWMPIATSQLRNPNYRIGQETECYVTLLGGDGGGLLANVNRWRSQMGLGPTTVEELEAAPRVRLLGQPTPLLVLEGAFSGMGDEARGGFMLYGAILSLQQGTVFVKLVGPKEEASEHREAFVAFCESLRVKGAEHGPDDGHDHSAHAEETPAPPATSTTGGTTGSAQGLAWTAPESWTQDGPRSMRLVSYTIGEDGRAECYISILGGGAGGVEANVNRWRDQVGLAPLSAAEVRALPVLDVLGGPATLFEAAGDYEGMSGESQEGQAILGLIRELDSSVLFVKMVGPVDLVAAERDRFVAFCSSLREG